MNRTKRANAPVLVLIKPNVPSVNTPKVDHPVCGVIMCRHKSSDNNRFSRNEKCFPFSNTSWNIVCHQRMSINLNDMRDRQRSFIVAGLQQCILGLWRGRHEISSPVAVSFHLICSNIIALGLLSNIVLIGNSITSLQMIIWNVSVLEFFRVC